MPCPATQAAERRALENCFVSAYVLLNPQVRKRSLKGGDGKEGTVDISIVAFKIRSLKGLVLAGGQGLWVPSRAVRPDCH